MACDFNLDKPICWSGFVAGVLAIIAGVTQLAPDAEDGENISEDIGHAINVGMR